MTMQGKMSGRTMGFYLGLAGGVLAVIALILYVIYGNVTGERNMMVLLPLTAAAALQVVSIFVDSDELVIVSPALCAVALSAFIVDSINTLVGYFFNLDMFGDASMIGSVAQISIFTGVAVVVLLVSSFMKKKAD